MSDYHTLIFNKIHSFHNFNIQRYSFFVIPYYRFGAFTGEKVAYLALIHASLAFYNLFIYLCNDKSKDKYEYKVC